jgi:hypothetical protein
MPKKWMFLGCVLLALLADCFMLLSQSFRGSFVHLLLGVISFFCVILGLLIVGIRYTPYLLSRKCSRFKKDLFTPGVLTIYFCLLLLSIPTGLYFHDLDIKKAMQFCLDVVKSGKIRKDVTGSYPEALPKEMYENLPYLIDHNFYSRSGNPASYQLRFADRNSFFKTSYTYTYSEENGGGWMIID